MHAAGRDDPEGAGLLRPVAARARADAAALRGGAAGQHRAFLAWVAERLAAEGVRVLVLIWDNAGWHVSRAVRAWMRDHNRQVKAARAGCRLLVCRLPSKSPWLNPIEPRWAHGKRAVVEPDRKLGSLELQRRLCDHYRCAHLPPLAQQLP